MDIFLNRHEWDVAALNDLRHIYRRYADSWTSTRIRRMTSTGIARLGVPAFT